MEMLEEMMEKRTQTVILTYDQFKMLANKFNYKTSEWDEWCDIYGSKHSPTFKIQQFNEKQISVEYEDAFKQKRFFNL